jgi:hypothetical protein
MKLKRLVMQAFDWQQNRRFSQDFGLMRSNWTIIVSRCSVSLQDDLLFERTIAKLPEKLSKVEYK